VVTEVGAPSAIHRAAALSICHRKAPDVPELMRELVEWINMELAEGELAPDECHLDDLCVRRRGRIRDNRLPIVRTRGLGDVEGRFLPNEARNLSGKSRFVKILLARSAWFMHTARASNLRDGRVALTKITLAMYNRSRRAPRPSDFPRATPALEISPRLAHMPASPEDCPA